jgi:hypothetical protein
MQGREMEMLASRQILLQKGKLSQQVLPVCNLIWLVMSIIITLKF